MRALRRSARLGGLAVAGAMAVAGAQPLAAQQTVRSDLPDEGFVDGGTPIRFVVDGVQAPDDRLAVLIAGQDVTALLVADGDALVYRPSPFPLPTGKHDVTVFAVGPRNEWTEIARFPLRVRGSLGFEERRFRPGIDLNLKSQPAEGHDPADVDLERATYGQLDGELRLGLEQIHSGASVGADLRLVGTSYQKEALRYFSDGDDAARVDLSSHDLRFDAERLDLSVGSIQFGDHRHLTTGISARGAKVDVGAGRVDGSFVASSATQLVGWDNFLGVTEPDNRLFTANVGVDALSVPGGLRIDASWMTGRVRPASGFNQGVISDFEESDGFSVRLRTNVLRGRVRLDAGFARSRFDNPGDSLLAQGRPLVEVRETRRNARYVDADLELLRDIPLWSAERARLAVGYRHERVDPLYRVVGSWVRADNLSHQFDVRADVAWLVLSGSFGRGEDNLDAVSSVLTTRTDRAAFTATLPLQRGASWLPNLDYRLDRTHQLGLGIPTNGGFDPSHVPDQVSLNHDVAAIWQLRRVRLGLQYNVSDQDNRQPGRENADFLTRRSSIQLGLTPVAVLDLGVDLSFDSRDDQGADVVAGTRRWGTSLSWRPLRSSSLSISFSDTFQDDDVSTFERTDRMLSAGWNSFVPFLEGFGGQYFLRFNHQSSRHLDVGQDFDADRMSWTVQFVLSLSAGRR